MDSLIDKIFPESNAKAVKKLWEDQECRPLIQKEISKKLLENDGIIEELPLSQIALLTSLSTFANSEDECFDVAHVVYWGVNRVDVLPLISEFKGEKEMAYRCLISLSFFKKIIIKKHERHAAPSPDFYRGVGVKSFHNIGKEDVSNHFYKWELFLAEMFL